jgi:predicted amidohydrolase
MASTLTCSLIQAQLIWENKKANLNRLQEKIEAISHTEIIILPEMFSTGFSMNTQLAEPINGHTVNWMKQIAANKKAVVTGSVMIEENKQFFNRLIFMLPNGEFGMYDKRHLFAFAGEHIPYTAGKKRCIASVKGWKLNLQICYDLRFPVWARQQMLQREPEYDILLYVANWPKSRIAAWKALLQARAIENECYTIGVNVIGKNEQIEYNGYSSVINSMGNILYQKENEEDTFTITLSKEELQQSRAKFPFLSDADSFQILI